MRDPPMEFLLEWSGERVAAHSHKPVARVRLADRSALWKMFSDPQVSLGDAYCAGRIEIDVELVQFLDLLYRADLQGRLAKLPRRARRARSYSPVSYTHLGVEPLQP